MSSFLIELAATKSTEMEIHLKSWRKMSGEYEKMAPAHKDSSYTELFDIIRRELSDMLLICLMYGAQYYNFQTHGSHPKGINTGLEYASLSL